MQLHESKFWEFYPPICKEQKNFLFFVFIIPNFQGHNNLEKETYSVRDLN
jgi:hypothetical protein